MIELIAIIITLLIAISLFRGAPYVPTHRKQVEIALDLLHVQPGEIVVDLGSGDGVFLKAAARRGLIAYGIEINPLLCLIAWVRCWQYRKQVHIRWRDMWLTPLPANVKGIFVFSGGPFMSRLNQKLMLEAKNCKIVSYGFRLSDFTLITSKDGLNLYKSSNES
jgi:16S rRNA A1518/A1519 N6-dimethyltransferase RsmA/KsgA/DIM1 with predicted DNA glycosylase/AP lyase activity